MPLKVLHTYKRTLLTRCVNVFRSNNFRISSEHKSQSFAYAFLTPSATITSLKIQMISMLEKILKEIVINIETKIMKES